MEIDFEGLMLTAVKDGLREGIKAKLSSSYGDNPFTKLIASCVEKNEAKLRGILDKSLASCMDDAEFQEQIATAVRHTLAKTLVARFGGVLERQVNALKSDPTTRARITVAIEEIVKSKV